jgi:hypothetical protein
MMAPISSIRLMAETVGLTWAPMVMQLIVNNQNWYNYASVNNLATLANVKHGWCGTCQPSSGNCLGGGGSGTWKLSKHTMPYLAGQASVKFRIIFGAGTTCNNYDGFAFDDITIKNAAGTIAVNPVLQPAGCTINNGAATLTYKWRHSSLFIYRGIRM